MCISWSYLNAGCKKKKMKRKKGVGFKNSNFLMSFSKIEHQHWLYAHFSSPPLSFSFPHFSHFIPHSIFSFYHSNRYQTNHIQLQINWPWWALPHYLLFPSPERAKPSGTPCLYYTLGPLFKILLFLHCTNIDKILKLSILPN